MKTYIYKVYDPSGNFVSTIDDVESPPIISSEMNTVGSELTVSLARHPQDYSEGVEVGFANIVKVYSKKDDEDEELFFQGKIVNYTPKYETNEGVDLVLYSLGSELDSYIYKTNETGEQDSSTGSSELGLGTGFKIAQSFIPDQPTLTSVDTKLYVDAPVDLTLSIHTDAGGLPNGSSIANGSLTQNITDTSATVIKWTFSTAPTVIVGNTYWIVVQP